MFVLKLSGIQYILRSLVVQNPAQNIYFFFDFLEFNYSTLSVEQTFFIPALIFIPHSIGR
jgi:hypothetical protein